MSLDPEFLRAFVATRYLLGARGEQLRQGLTLDDVGLNGLLGRLCSQERPARAQALALELSRVARSLEHATLRG